MLLYSNLYFSIKLIWTIASTLGHMKVQMDLMGLHFKVPSKKNDKKIKMNYYV